MTEYCNYSSVMQNTAKPVAYPIESVSNALRLLHLLRERAVGEVPASPTDGALGPGIGVVEASRRLRVAPSTAHRLFTMLVFHDFAVQDAAKRYHLGPAFSMLEAKSRPLDLRGTMLPVLRRVSDELDETAHLMALEGPSVRFLAGVEGSHPDRIDSKEGIVLPAHTTAGGRAMLAELSRAELRALYPHGLPELYAATVTDLPGLSRQLAAVLRRGYAISLEESERGIASVAVALRDANGRVHGAVAVALRASRCPGARVHQIGSLLLAQTRQLAPQLGAVA